MDKRESKDEAYYTVINMPNGQGCRTCISSHFGELKDPKRVGSCDKVLGPIQPDAWCMNFVPRPPSLDGMKPA